MATDFKPAQDQVNESKRAMLEAMARHGSEGKARFEAARGNIQSAQQEAVQRALESRVGGPAGTRGFEDVYGRNLASLSSLQAGAEQNLADHSRANEAYFDKISGALPIVQARMDEGIAKDRADLERELAIRQQGIEGAISAQEKANAAAKAQAEQDAIWEAEKRAHERSKWAREESEAAAKSAGSGGLDLPYSQLQDHMLGAARETKKTVAPAAGVEALLGASVAANNMMSRLTGGRVKPIEGPRPMTNRNTVALSDQALAQQIAKDVYGLNPATVSGMPKLVEQAAKAPVAAKNIMSWANTDQKTADTILKDKDYTSARDWAFKQILEGASWPVVVDTFSGNFLDRGEGKAKKTRTYQALVEEFLPLFRAADLMDVE